MLSTRRTFLKFTASTLAAVAISGFTIPKRQPAFDVNAQYIFAILCEGWSKVPEYHDAIVKRVIEHAKKTVPPGLIVELRCEPLDYGMSMHIAWVYYPGIKIKHPAGKFSDKVFDRAMGVYVIGTVRT